jgi:hypothetical protein
MAAAAGNSGSPKIFFAGTKDRRQPAENQPNWRCVEMEKKSAEETRQPCYLCEKLMPIGDLTVMTVTWRNSPGVCPACQQKLEDFHRYKLEEAALRKPEGMYFAVLSREEEEWARQCREEEEGSG